MQKGFTVVELVTALIALAIMSGIGLALYAVYHFLTKFW